MPDYKADYNRKFCRICTHREYDIQSGILCGLTKKKPDFTEFCPNFERDQEEINQIAVNTKSKLLANHYEFLGRVSQIKPKALTADKRVLYKSKTDYYYLIAVLVIILAVVTGQTVKNPDNSGVIGLTILIPITLLLIYFSYRSLKKKKEVISIDKKGFKAKGKHFYWIEITEIVIKHNSRTESYDFKVYVYLSNGTYELIEIAGTKENRDELSSILKDYW